MKRKFCMHLFTLGNTKTSPVSPNDSSNQANLKMKVLDDNAKVEHEVDKTTDASTTDAAATPQIRFSCKEKIDDI
ncbi:hypothetical protein V6N12_069084 [Hibiscus sabdariffa]|uniref:Uncharacterized protein n=1 Tax=Hibiscus sabdariffa TaxID=183260 RepID=A0ABR2FCW0_9ROSI